MKITIDSVDYSQMRYPTCGDWQFLHGNHLLVTVARLGDWKMEACLGVHELCEALICKWLGITQEVVDEFDFSFKGDGEPGDEPDCPYRVPHRVASGIEFLLSLALNVNWTEYEARLNAL